MPTQIPSAEVIEAAKPPPPRILRVSYEELDAWRQVLTSYRKTLLKTLQEGVS